MNPEKIYVLPFTLNIGLWQNIDIGLKSTFSSPVKLKFNELIKENMNSIKASKGIYMFFIEPDFPFLPPANYLVYIGRVTKGNTFFKRFYDYTSSIGERNKRRNIQLLTNLWPDKTWVYFYPLSETDQRISEIEKMLFNNIVPPLNADLTAKGARNSRSIYN
jgi:hypothetical protein